MRVTYVCNLDLGKHGAIDFRTFHVAKEAYSYRIDNNFISNINEIINFVRKHDGLLCVRGHYRTINVCTKEGFLNILLN